MISEEAKRTVQDKMLAFSGDCSQLVQSVNVSIENDCLNPDIWNEISKQAERLESKLNSVKGICHRFMQISANVSAIEDMKPTKREEQANKKLAEEAAEICPSGDYAKED